MEADFVTGPAKNLLEFAQRSARPADHLPTVELSIIAYLRGEQPETEFIRATRDASIPLAIVHEGHRFDPSVRRQLRHIVDSRNPDIVQTHNVKSHFFMRLSGIARERLWLAFHHGYTTTDLKMRCYNAVNAWSLRGARHVVTTCGAFVDQLAAEGVPRDRLTVQHNSVKLPEAVPAQMIRAARNGIAVTDARPLLVSIGRLSREKGHVDLINALAKLRERIDAFHLVIVGEGPERSRIEAARAQLNLQAHVTLVGLQHDVRPYYMLADVVVLPSHSEGSPNVLLEAMMAARPIVATRVGGVPEIARHEDTALLVPPRDPEQMADALARMLTEESLRARLATRAHEVAATCYSPDAYRRSMIGLYQQLLAADGPR